MKIYEAVVKWHNIEKQEQFGLGGLDIKDIVRFHQILKEELTLLISLYLFKFNFSLS